MDEQAKPILTLAKCSLILKIICTALTVGLQVFAAPVLKVIYPALSSDSLSAAANHPLNYVMPMLSLSVFLFLYYLLMGQIRQPSSFSDPLLILILVTIPAFAGISILYNLFLNVTINRLYDAEAIGGLSYIRSVTGCLTFFSGVINPMLAAAAGMNRQRWRSMNP